MYPVEGRVVFPDGRPLTCGRVAVDTGDAATGHWGAIRPDGTFVMGTRTPTDGVPKGRFRVYLVGANDEAEAAAVTPKPPAVNPRFANPDTSGLVFSVPDQTRWEIVVTH